MLHFLITALLLGTVPADQAAALDEGRELRIRCQIGSADGFACHGTVVEILREILDGS